MQTGVHWLPTLMHDAVVVVESALDIVHPLVPARP